MKNLKINNLFILNIMKTLKISLVTLVSFLISLFTSNSLFSKADKIVCTSPGVETLLHTILIGCIISIILLIGDGILCTLQMSKEEC